MSHKWFLVASWAICIVVQSAFAADTQPPIVAITEPANGSTVRNAITIAASASDNVAVASVSFKVDGAAVAAPQTNEPFTFSLDTAGLPNGLHTLSALATDSSGNSTRSALVFITVTNSTVFNLASGPYVIENLGSVMSSTTQERQVMFRLSANNDLHLLLYYVVVDDAKYPLQILDVNLTQRTARLVDGAIGRPGPYGTALHPNGKIYLGTFDPGYFAEYDPATGATIVIGKLHPTVARNTQMVEIGDDGWVYIGEQSYTGGCVGRYNPSTKVFQDFGLMDTNFNASQYSYTIGADTRYVYVGLGQQPWYLAAYDTQTGGRTIYWRDQSDTSGAVYQGVAGGWYYWRNATNGGNKYYVLTNGAPSQIASLPAVKPWNNRGNVIHDKNNFPAAHGVEINLADAYPDSAVNKAIVRWHQTNVVNWQSVEMTGFRLQPLNIRRLYSWQGRQLFGFADFYGPVFLYDPATGNPTRLGLPQFSVYDGLFEAGRVYLSGYPSVTMEYNPSMDWTLSGSTTNRFLPTVNPYQLTGAFGRHHYYSVFGADGMVYIGGHHERNSVGGELGWYDPITGTNGSLRTPFLAIGYDVSDLKSALGGTKLVYASENEKLFVFDVESKQIEREITPLPGIGGPLGKITEVAPGIILGAVSNSIYKVDIRDGSILYTNRLPGLAFGSPYMGEYYKRLSLGPDGYVWLLIDNSLFRIDPADGSMTKIVDTAIMNTAQKSLLFKDGDLYLYGEANLYRIRGILKALSPPIDLQVLEPGGI